MRSNNIFVLPLFITIFSILIIASNTIGPPAVAQNSTELMQQLAANGTSFDQFIKVINARYSFLTPAGRDGYILAANYCTSSPPPPDKTTFCNFAVATVFELCQAIPDQLYICASPAVSNYLSNRNITDGQTDKMAWMFILHSKQIMNSTSPIR
jgi:hypothetical protein